MRFGPAKGTGEARSEKIGSTRMFFPAMRTRTVAWPIHVTEGFASGACKAARSIATTGIRHPPSGSEIAVRSDCQRRKSPKSVVACG